MQQVRGTGVKGDSQVSSFGLWSGYRKPDSKSSFAELWKINCMDTHEHQSGVGTLLNSCQASLQYTQTPTANAISKKI